MISTATQTNEETNESLSVSDVQGDVSSPKINEPFVPISPTQIDDSEFKNQIADKDKRFQDELGKLQNIVSELEAKRDSPDMIIQDEEQEIFIEEKPPSKKEKAKKKAKKTKITTINNGQNFLSLKKGYYFIMNYKPKSSCVRNRLPNGILLTEYANGDYSHTYKDGSCCVYHGQNQFFYFPNGDYMQTFPDESTAYQYADTKCIELRLPNQDYFIFFANGQKETHYHDGRIKVSFPNGIIMRCNPDGSKKLTRRKKIIKKNKRKTSKKTSKQF